MKRVSKLVTTPDNFTPKSRSFPDGNEFKFIGLLSEFKVGS